MTYWQAEEKSKMIRKKVDYSPHDPPYKSVGKQGEGYSPDIENTIRSLRVEIKRSKENNDRLVEAQERLAMA